MAGMNPILAWIKGRINKNKNVIISINGATGSGKTYAALTLGYQVSQMLGTNFSIKDNMDFNFSDLLKKTMKKENQLPGTPFIFEEVGAFTSGASSRGWQSQANKFFFSFMQTTRHRRQVLIFTCPHFSFLEKGARSLVHMQMEMDGIDFNKKLSFVRPYVVQVNSRSGKFYFKYLRVTREGSSFRFNRMAFECPPDKVSEEYEVVKTKFTTKLNNEIIEQGKEKEKKVDKRKSNIDNNEILRLLHKGINRKEIAAIMGVDRKTIYNHLNREEIRDKICFKVPNIA